MIFSFGEHFFDVARRELRRDGELVALEPQVCDLLIYLIQNRDRVVSKDEMLEAVWGGRIVSESALTTRINAVRKAVGDSGAAQRLIRTFSRKGVRFIGEVHETRPPSATADGPLTATEHPLKLTHASPDKPSIVVLPFANLSGDPEQQSFADGMVEEIVTVLSRIRWLFVIARNSSFTYNGRSTDVRQVGSELGARYLLEGSVRQAGSRVRIAAQLIDTTTGAHIWADHFDGSLDAVFAFQDQVAIGVAAAVESSLRSTQIDRSVEVPEQAKAFEMRSAAAILAGRRQLTVVSCNLAEAAALASRLDPEDLRDLIAAYHRAIAEIVTRFEGFVAKQLGDEIQIYFGYPHAHEDDPERAIRCALAVADTVTGLGPDEELRTRVGIATSMVVVGDPIDGGRSWERSVVGEAPSLATRLQDFAPPNSVLIAEGTRRLLGELFEYHAVEVRGIAGPVPAWQVLRPSVIASRFEALRGSALTGLVGRDEEIDLLLRRWARAKAGDGQIVLISGEPGLDQGQTGGSRIQTIPGRGYHSVAPVTRVGVSADFTAPADIRDSARPRLSIVVLPFTNLGDDREQQYFADGITEDITTELSRFANMIVISRTTAFTYREKLVDTKQIGRELGVRYMLEGSVRGSGNQLRVNVQLIDAETDAHLWAERFDRHMGDLLALQREIASYIANALGVELIAVEAARPTEHPDALDYILRGRVASVKPLSRENYIETIGLFEHALALDPQSVEAQSYLATALAGRRINAVTDTAADDLARAEGLAGHALAAAPRNPLVHFAKGQVLCAQHRSKEALFEYATALASNRNMVGALHGIGHCKLLAGSIEETIPLVSQAVRLSPRDPQIGDWYFEIGRAYLLQSRTDEAINWFEKARSAQPGVPAAHSHLAAAYALKGETEPAAAELAEARRLQGGDLFSSIGGLKAYFERMVTGAEVPRLVGSHLFDRFAQGRHAGG